MLQVTAESALGQLIKRILAEDLDNLVKVGAVDEIKEGGNSILNRQLLEVLTENYVARATVQSSVNVEIED